jgi:hypothetical protein
VLVLHNPRVDYMLVVFQKDKADSLPAADCDLPVGVLEVGTGDDAGLLLRLARSAPTPCRCPSLTQSNRRGTRPICPVVWEGWHREVSPYPDLSTLPGHSTSHSERLFMSFNDFVYPAYGYPRGRASRQRPTHIQSHRRSFGGRKLYSIPTRTRNRLTERNSLFTL